MKYRLILFIVFSMLIETVSLQADSGWYSRENYKPETRIKITCNNQLNFDREDCPIIIPRQQMPLKNVYQEWFTIVDPSLPPEDDAENGRVIPSQTDDINKDGIWDELFFMADFKANEEKTLYVYIGRNTSEIKHFTHAETGSYGRYIVPWWESEQMGWKLWFPDSADMYGRRGKKLVSNLNLTNIYGHDAPYDAGIDLMLVGKTFGAGGICLFEEPDLPDSLSRPRFNPYQGKGPFNDARYACEIIVNGPLRSIVRAHIMNWRTGQGEYDLDQYFTAYKNKNYYTSRVRYNTFLPEKSDTVFGCGIRKMPYENECSTGDGFIVSSTDSLRYVITPIEGDPGLKKGVKEYLGIAMIVKQKYNPQFRATESYEGNYTFRIPVTENLTYEYLAAGAWSEGEILTGYNEFKDYIVKTAQEYNNPVDVQIQDVENK
ncbi:MAG: DUF4861 family protein [Candidatus Latescibacteria bacterium]|nr:DUF4861 family protein [Candidatus Latescibacterota bacterium]